MVDVAAASSFRIYPTNSYIAECICGADRYPIYPFPTRPSFSYSSFHKSFAGEWLQAASNLLEWGRAVSLKRTVPSGGHKCFSEAGGWRGRFILAGCIAFSQWKLVFMRSVRCVAFLTQCPACGALLLLLLRVVQSLGGTNCHGRMGFFDSGLVMSVCPLPACLSVFSSRARGGERGGGG